MKTLAIETSGKTFSIAVADGTHLIGEVFWQSGLMHSEKLIPAIDWFLKEIDVPLSEISKIAVSTGPGSFTGIRVGMVCARTLAQQLRLPLVGMSSLEILAASVESMPGYTVYPVIDALRDEVFTYTGKKKEPVIKTVKAVIADIKKTKKHTLLIGSAVPKYFSTAPKHVHHAPEHLNYPRAGVLALQAHSHKGQRFDKIKPVYIRRSWAEEKNK